jgi:hypothetical protein
MTYCNDDQAFSCGSCISRGSDAKVLDCWVEPAYYDGVCVWFSARVKKRIADCIKLVSIRKLYPGGFTLGLLKAVR